MLRKSKKQRKKDRNCEKSSDMESIREQEKSSYEIEKLGEITAGKGLMISELPSIDNIQKECNTVNKSRVSIFKKDLNSDINASNSQPSLVSNAIPSKQEPKVLNIADVKSLELLKPHTELDMYNLQSITETAQETGCCNNEVTNKNITVNTNNTPFERSTITTKHNRNKTADPLLYQTQEPTTVSDLNSKYHNLETKINKKKIETNIIDNTEESTNIQGTEIATKNHVLASTSNTIKISPVPIIISRKSGNCPSNDESVENPVYMNELRHIECVSKKIEPRETDSGPSSSNDGVKQKVSQKICNTVNNEFGQKYKLEVSDDQGIRKNEIAYGEELDLPESSMTGRYEFGRETSHSEGKYLKSAVENDNGKFHQLYTKSSNTIYDSRLMSGIFGTCGRRSHVQENSRYNHRTTVIQTPQKSPQNYIPSHGVRVQCQACYGRGYTYIIERNIDQTTVHNECQLCKRFGHIAVNCPSLTRRSQIPTAKLEKLPPSVWNHPQTVIECQICTKNGIEVLSRKIQKFTSNIDENHVETYGEEINSPTRYCHKSRDQIIDKCDEGNDVEENPQIGINKVNNPFCTEKQNTDIFYEKPPDNSLETENPNFMNDSIKIITEGNEIEKVPYRIIVKSEICQLCKNEGHVALNCPQLPKKLFIIQKDEEPEGFNYENPPNVKCQICKKNHSAYNCSYRYMQRRDFYQNSGRKGKPYVKMAGDQTILSRAACHYCKRPGHYIRDCPIKLKYEFRVTDVMGNARDLSTMETSAGLGYERHKIRTISVARRSSAKLS